MWKRKISNNKAFTLGETLVATLIMLMVSAILVAGIPAAKNAYEKVVVRSNAEVTMSTAIYALRNELSMARDIDIKDDNTTISYTNGSNGARSTIKLDNAQGIMCQRYSYYEKGDKAEAETSNRLVSKAAADGLIVTYESVEPGGDGIVTFNNLSVCDGENEVLTREFLSIITF